MEDVASYGQFCPVAKAAEIITTRWTPLILREMVCGSRRFNEIHRGVPLMSRTLLSRRLRELESAGVIRKTQATSPEYLLTEMGEELRPVIIALGAWGLKWVESAYDGDEWDAGVLMWDIRRRIDVSLIDGRRVLQFEYHDAPAAMRLWWLVIENRSADLCQKDPGHDVDLYIGASVRKMARVWIGKESLAQAIEAEDIELHGDRDLIQSMKRWFKLAVVAEVTRSGSLLVIPPVAAGS
ncbi:MAG: helix-turn-helix transcriptional regulator [Rhodospirillales bacterium]|nr:MAG: helix-turn-helix transcriptional regulator [Rhodospirillales bacterium]